MEKKKNKIRLKVKVMNPPTEERKAELLRIITQLIQDTYYS